MIRKILLGLLAASLAVSATAPEAHASDERPCVSQQEYQDVRVGWRQARVADHFDLAGRPIGYEEALVTDTVWVYRKCSAWGPGGDYVGIGYGDHDNGYVDRYMRMWDKSPQRPQQLLTRIGTFDRTVTPDGGRACVTAQEFRDVRPWAWSWSRVVNHFDTQGELMSVWGSYGEYDTYFRYRKCSAWGRGGRYAAVGFDNYSGDVTWVAVYKDARWSWPDTFLVL